LGQQAGAAGKSPVWQSGKSCRETHLGNRGSGSNSRGEWPPERAAAQSLLFEDFDKLLERELLDKDLKIKL
jgi:hypothetical protein